MEPCAVAFAKRSCRNIGVLQTTVAELVTVERHQRKFTPVSPREAAQADCVARAYSIMPFVWCLGWVPP